MFCTRCGQKLFDTARYCERCGAPTRVVDEAPSAPPSEPEAPLYVAPAGLSRPVAKKKIAGVCAGCARYFGVDVTLMRLLWVAAAIFSGGLAVVLYIVAWFLMPPDYSPQYAV